MEIEKKYKVKSIPDDLTQYNSKHIQQGYLCRTPVIRIRKSNDNYILTYKSKDNIEQTLLEVGCVSNEVELPLTKEAYQHLCKKIDGHLICKTRYILPLQDGLVAELDIFSGVHKGLVVVEVEFPDGNTARSFSPPEWFGEEVSSDSRYQNNNLIMRDSINELT